MMTMSELELLAFISLCLFLSLAMMMGTAWYESRERDERDTP